MMLVSTLFTDIQVVHTLMNPELRKALVRYGKNSCLRYASTSLFPISSSLVAIFLLLFIMTCEQRN
jgi:hypothetical protein